jgi:hypothetical protein
MMRQGRVIKKAEIFLRIWYKETMTGEAQSEMIKGAS